MVRRIQEEHLPHHHFRDGIQRRQVESAELLGRGRAIGGKTVEDVDHIGVPRYDPCMQERIPVHGILAPELVIERVWVCEHFGIEQMVEAELTSICRQNGRWRGRDHAEIPGGEVPSRRHASSSLIAASLACTEPSISEAISRKVG